MHFYGVKVKLHVDVHMQRYSCIFIAGKEISTRQSVRDINKEDIRDIYKEDITTSDP